MGVVRLHNRRLLLNLTTPSLTLPLAGGGNRDAVCSLPRTTHVSAIHEKNLA